MKNKNTMFLVQAAAIGAIYVVLTLLFAPLSYGEVQVRFSEALTILPYFTPAAIPGLFVGCILSNLLGRQINVSIAKNLQFIFVLQKRIYVIRVQCLNSF